MKPGIYEAMNSERKPCIVTALEGRRLTVCRNRLDNGWHVSIKRVKNQIKRLGEKEGYNGDIAFNKHTKRTVQMLFNISDVGLDALINTMITAQHIHKTRKGKQ